MKQNEKTTNRILRNSAKRLVNNEYNGWPPVCGGILYQPKRPAKVTPEGIIPTPMPQR